MLPDRVGGALMVPVNDAAITPDSVGGADTDPGLRMLAVTPPVRVGGADMVAGPMK
jgi:hypothetical protein